MPGPTGVFASEHITVRAVDGAALSRTLAHQTGDPGLGSETPNNREYVDVRVRHMQAGRFLGDEQPVVVSVEALACDEVDDLIDLCLGRGAYAPGGASPLTSCDLATGTPCTHLYVQVEPPAGAPVITRWERAYLSVSSSAAAEGTKRTLSWDCYGRSVV